MTLSTIPYLTLTKARKMGETNEVPQGLTLAIVGAGKSSEATKNEDLAKLARKNGLRGVVRHPRKPQHHKGIPNHQIHSLRANAFFSRKTAHHLPGPPGLFDHPGK